MKFNSNHNEIIHYNFPTFDSKNQLPKSFFNFKIFIPINKNNIKIKNYNYHKIDAFSILDSGSICNFISKNLIQKFNLVPKITKNTITIKGISGTKIINKFIELVFQFYLKIQNKFYLISFKEKFLVIDNIPIDILIGNTFMKKYELHYNDKYKYIYTYLNFNQFMKLNFSKNLPNFKNLKNLKNFKSKIKNHNDLNYFTMNNYTLNNENIGSTNSLYYPNSYENNSNIQSNSHLYYLKYLSNSILNSIKSQKFTNFSNFNNSFYVTQDKLNLQTLNNNKYNYNMQIYSLLANNDEYLAKKMRMKKKIRLSNK